MDSSCPWCSILLCFYVFPVAVLVRVFLQTGVIFNPDLPKAVWMFVWRCSKMFEALCKVNCSWICLHIHQDFSARTSNWHHHGHRWKLWQGVLFLEYVFTRRFRMYIVHGCTLEVWRSWIMEIIWIWPISKSAGLVVVAPMPSLGSIKLGDWRFVNQLGNEHMYTIEHYWTHTKDVCVSISYS